jgi:hypothetical protein
LSHHKKPCWLSSLDSGRRDQIPANKTTYANPANGY